MCHRSLCICFIDLASVTPRICQWEASKATEQGERGILLEHEWGVGDHEGRGGIGGVFMGKSGQRTYTVESH